MLFKKDIDVDEVLSALLGNDLKVYKFDFNSANKFSKEHIKALSIIYDNFSVLLSSFLTDLLRSECEVSVASIREMRYSDYENSIAIPAVITTINLNPLDGFMVWEIPQALAYTIISRVLGGTGSGAMLDRELSEIDFAILKNTINQVLPLLNQVFSKVIETGPSLSKLQVTLKALRAVLFKETIALVSLNVRIEGETNKLKICIPRKLLEPVSKKLNTKYLSLLPDSGKRNEKGRLDLMDRLMNTQLYIRAYISETNVLVNDIANLQEGDVIKLDSKTDDLIKLKINNYEKLYGVLGVKDNRYAVRITEILNGEEA